MEAYRTEGWDTERRGSDLQSGNQFEYHAFPQTLDELELEFKIEAMELGRIRDKEEDEENYKHRKDRGEVFHLCGLQRRSAYWISKLHWATS
ncbi:hypothetical protein V6Z11_A12G024000 [Gossypium hirsutum]